MTNQIDTSAEAVAHLSRQLWQDADLLDADPTFTGPLSSIWAMREASGTITALSSRIEALTDEIDASGDKRKVPDKRLTEANVMDSAQYVFLSKHRANGLSNISFPDIKSALMGHNGGPSMGRSDAPAGGLVTGYDVLSPYGV